MKQTNGMPEDSFEKARSAFFGTVTATPNQNAPASGATTPRNEPPRETSGQLTQAMAGS
jgi:hypothetical protein